LSDGTSHIVKLYPVLYIPSAATRLIATGALCKQGYIAIQDEHANIIFKDKRSQSTYLEGFTKPYSVTIPWAEGIIVKTHKNNSTILTKVDNVKIWHKRLGHPDKLVLKQGLHT
ncbi:MAG TPA: GAG-pre-integrase domain-containing protein, partial [Methylomirabilota bacterium]|nr:GAG-pre-integrase domain-containing protein [Methylomirabilota bacterium]